MRRKISSGTHHPLHIVPVPLDDLQDRAPRPFSEPVYHLIRAPDQVVRGANPQGLFRLRKRGQVLPGRLLQVERAPHAAEYLDGCLYVGLGRVGIFQGATHKAAVGIGERSGFERLPDPERIHDQFVRQVEGTLHALEFGLHETDVKAYIVTNQYVRCRQELLNLVGYFRKSGCVFEVLHGNTVYGLRARRYGNIGLHTQRQGALLASLIETHGNFHDLIGVRVFPGRLHVECDHYFIHCHLPAVSIEFNYPYRPALVDETERALRSGERLTAFKILIAPSASEARFFRLALARAGARLLNVEAVTLRSLARLILRTVPGAEPTVFWGGDASQVVVSQCLEDIGAPPDHFLRRSPATAARLLSAMRVRGVDASVWNGAEGDPLVADLLASYTEMLRRHSALDPTGLLLRAADEAAEFVRLREPTLLLKLDDIQPMPAERMLLERLEGLVPAVETIGHLREAPTQLAATRRITARDRDDEVMRVLGDILASGTPFDEIQIAMAQPAVYEPRLAAAARSHGIPAVMDHGVLFFDTVPGRHVRALLKWIAEGLRPEYAGACARLGVFNQDDVSARRRLDVELLLDAWPVDIAGLLTPSYTDLLMKEAGRRSRAARSLIHFARTHLQELIDSSGQLRSDVALPHVMGWIRRVLQGVPGRDATWTEAMNTALRGRAAQVLPLSFTMPAARAADILLRSLEGVRMPGERLLGGDAPCGRMLVVPLEQAALSMRRKTWVLGMDDRASAGATADDLAGLPRSSLDVLRRLGHETGHGNTAPVPIGSLLDRLSERTSEITLCMASYDVREARELFPHAACAGREPVSDTPEPVALVPVLAPGAELGVRRATAAWEERSGPSWTVQNGILGEVERRTQASASSLERLSQCPYRYFITDVLRVRAEERRTEWLTAAERGSLMHDVFRDAFALGLVARPDGMDALTDTLRTRLHAHARLSPPPGAYTLEAAEEALISMVHTLRALNEKEADQWVQTEAEWPFEDIEAGPWQLRGRIDRVDRNVHGMERVLDYKTGSSGPYERRKLTALQQHLQWFVYALVRRQSEQADVAASGYLFMKDGEWARLESVDHPLEYDGMAHLEVLAGRVDAGWFPQAAGHNESPCRFCDVRPICGDVNMVGTMLKQKNAPDEEFSGRLASWWYADKHLKQGEMS